MKVEFNETLSVSLDTSFGTIKQENDVNLHITVGINSDVYGWFEVYDEETGGNEWYAEGGLWFDNKELTDYDGVFSLPQPIINKLKELGYDTSYVD